MRILGLGTAVPERSLPQEEIARLIHEHSGAPADEERALAVLFRRAGVRSRASVLFEDGGRGGTAVPCFAGGGSPGTGARMDAWHRHAPALGTRAARAALADAGVAPDRVTHLVTVSCTGFSAPGVDLAIAAELGLSPAVERTNVGFMGCQAALNAFRVADALGSRGPGRAVLVVAVELCTLHFDPARRSELAVPHALFGDGAGAAVVGAGGDGPRLAASGAHLLPDSADHMTWRIGDRGFVMGISAEVPDRIGEHLAPWLDAWLARHGRTRAEVGTFAVHPGGKRILDAVQAALDLPGDALEASRRVLSDHGNMSSATMLFVLDGCRARAAPRPMVALAFGPGLTVEAALFE